MLIQLDISPYLATVINSSNVELGSFGIGEIEVAEYAGGIVYEASEVAAGRCEVDYAAN